MDVTDIMQATKAGDFRDWDGVRAWAAEIADALQPGS